ncbi:hypothetical protein BDP27DRAFT_480579 [Rhodocollybia butyracea]|uniref:Uncharacterized protein n=1 Tax=Rhodocollybia butyracea TaxID=206335 RepID=A0A9P5UGL9_9AGAR|nr:hypothetical protein BDP27DRAFT_480579 [Rhodocollybia butyracea]
MSLSLPQDYASSPPTSRAPSSSPSSSESSILDVSFDYNLDDKGNIVRNSKGSGTSSLSTPPNDFSFELPSPPPRRASLSRSESAYPVLNGPTTASSDREKPSGAPARSFHRVASGPIPTTTVVDSAGPPIRTLPRTRLEQYETRQKRHTDELRARLASTALEFEEKENTVPSADDLHSRPSASTSRSVVPTRPARMILKGTGSKPQIDRISEIPAELESDGGEDAYVGYGDHGHGYQSTRSHSNLEDDEGMPPFMASRSLQPPPHSAGVQPLNESIATRPRRSASLSDALRMWFASWLSMILTSITLDYPDEHHVPAQSSQLSQRPSSSRPGSSLGLRREQLSVVPPRRVADEDRRSKLSLLLLFVLLIVLNRPSRKWTR